MRTINNQNGFTLLEVLIALFIFTIGILGVATMQITSIKGNSKGWQISDASDRTADRIETVLALDYDDPQLIDGAGTNDGLAGLDDLPNSDGTADSDGDGINDIFWNVAVDYPHVGTKTVKVFAESVVNGKIISMEMIKVGRFR